MSKFTNKFHKAIAIFSAVLLLAGTFNSVTIFAQGASSVVVSYTGACDNEAYPLSITSNYPDYKLQTSEVNILKDKPLDIKAYNAAGEVESRIEGSTGSFTDGYAKDAGTGIYYAGNVEGNYLDLTFSLNGTASLKNFVIFNHRTPSIATVKYSLYAAETPELLDSSEALITHENTEGKECQIFDISNVDNAKFFRIRVLNPGSDEYARFYELALYASSYTENSETTLAYTGTMNGANPFSAVSDWPEYKILTEKVNILADKPLDIKAGNAAGSINYNILGSTGSFTDGYAKDAGAGIEYGGNIDGNYLDLTYRLGGVADIDNIAVFNYNGKSLATKKYALYAAASEEALETAEPFMVYENTTGDMCQVFSVSGINDAKYFRIRILNSGDDSYARLCEIAVYASSFEETAETVLAYSGTKNGGNAFSSTTDYPDYKLNTTSENILSGKPVGFESYDATGYKETGFEPVDPGVLTNGYAKDQGVGYYIGGQAESRYLDITFTLNGNANPKNIAVFNGNGSLATKKYALYAANSYQELNSGEPLITFDNTNSDGVQVFSVGGLYNVKYFRIRVLTPNDNVDNCVRFLELAMYGEFTPDNVVTAYSGNLDNADHVLTATADNVLTASPNSVLFNKAATLVKEGGLDVTPDPGISTSTIADGSVNNAFYLWAGDGKYIDLTYDLNGSVTPESMLIVNANDKSLRTYNYAVYMANSLEELDTAQPLISVVNFGDQRCQQIDFTNVPSAKFVRIRLLNTNVLNEDYFRINEILLTGNYDETPLVSFTDYEAKDGYIIKVSANTGKDEFLGKLTLKEGASIVFEGLTSDNVVSTGTVVTISTDTEQVKYTVAVTGDLNSDGKLTVLDLVRMKKHIAGLISLSGASALAMDLDFNGSVNGSDLAGTRLALLQTAALSK